MTTQVAPLGLRLFLEGIEVPVIAAQVSIQPGAPAAASIQIVPTDSALLLLPRTCVHLFFLDNEFISASSTTREDTFGRNRDDQNRFRIADEQYKLLFGGEIIGYNYNKSPSQRSLVLQCLDFSNYWDTCYQWFADYSVSGDGLTDRHHNFVGAGQFVFDNVAAGTRWVIGNVLQSRPRNPRYQKLKGLLGGYIHLLETISGVRPKKNATYKSLRGINDFFTIAELRYNLSGMMGAVENDTTSAKMFGYKAFRNWLRQGMSSAGSFVSFRDVSKIVGQYIFHEAYPNPAALYVEEGTRIQNRVPELVNETSSGREAFDELQAARDNIESTITNLRNVTTDPREYKEADTLQLLKDARSSLESASEIIRASAASDAAVVSNFVLLATSGLLGAITSFRSSARLVFNDNDYALSAGVAEAIASQLDTVLVNLDRILKTNKTRKTRERDVEVTSGPHLFNQLILPETWMVAPPRCNVLFPDMYFQFSYSRNFMREVSRLHVQAGLGIISGGGGSKFLGRHYLAPNIRDVRGDIARKTIFRSHTTLLPHEIHSGIIPKLDWVTEGHRWGVHAAKAVGKNALGKKITYIQRLANFQFFNHRWAARQMSVQAKFNPNLVIGFPGVVIDRSTPSIGAILSATDNADVGTFMLPTAYVGKIGSIQHNVGQDGGVTTVVYTHARAHRGIDDDFLGVVGREQKASTTETTSVDVDGLIESVRAGVPPSDLNMLLVQLLIQGRLTEGLRLNAGVVTKITYTGGDEEYTFDDLSVFRISFDEFLSLRARQVSRQGELQDAENGVFLSKAFDVDIKTTPLPGRFVRQEGAAPFEELIRPAWYAPNVWDNNNIGQAVYLPLLGTRSIVDDAQIGEAESLAALIKSAVQNADSIPHAVEVKTDDYGNIILEVDGRPAATLGLNLTTGTSVETAVDGLTTLYGLLKKRDLSVQEFIESYTKRPIATLVQVLGDSDLQYAREGDGSGEEAGEIIPRIDGTVPFEGFHSRAFGPYNVNVQHRVDTGDDKTKPQAGEDALLGLIPSDKREEFLKAGTTLSRGSSKREVPIPGYLDPRGRAQARVRVYADELKVMRGIASS